MHSIESVSHTGGRHSLGHDSEGKVIATASSRTCPTRRARVTNWLWLILNAVALVSIAQHSYQDGWEILGKISGVVTLIAAVVFVMTNVLRAQNRSVQDFLRDSFVFVSLGYIAGAVSFADGGLSLLALIQPVLLAAFFVYNRRFLAWAEAG